MDVGTPGNVLGGLETRRAEEATVAELLKGKRKPRLIKSCLPCRHRKVKCDGATPCSTCVARKHPNLCHVPSAHIGISHASKTLGNGSISTSPPPTLSEPIQGTSPSVTGTEGTDFHPSYYDIMGLSSSAAISEIDATIDRLGKIEKDITRLRADLVRRRDIGKTQTVDGSTIFTPQADANARPTHVLSETGNGPSVAASPASRFIEDTTGATIFLGSHSDPPLALGCRRADDGLMGGALFDNLMPRTYPFSDLWRPTVRSEEICHALPDDSEILSYWQVYQTCVFPFYPALVTLEQFNMELFRFLDIRSAIDRKEATYDDVDASWLSLLFVVLALGVQFSDDPIKERDLRSKVFICSSFQFLRMSNFLNNTDMNAVQAMALIGHFLRNNQDSNTAWVLMGATVRAAQSIGLHEEALSSQSEGNPDGFLRRRFWWMLTWQDTFLSFTYDRPPIATNPRCPIPYAADPAAGHSFPECIFALCQGLQEWADSLRHARVLSDHDYLEMTVSYKQRFEEIVRRGAPFLSQKTYCRSLKDHLERLALHIHAGYGICRFLKFFLENVSPTSEETKLSHQSFSQECAWKAVEVIESFLDMYRFSSSVCRSWAFVHNAVSCAITLSSLGGILERTRVQALIQKLTAVLDKEEKLSEWVDADTNRRHYGPYSRALNALKETFLMDVGTDGVGQFQRWQEFH